MPFNLSMLPYLVMFLTHLYPTPVAGYPNYPPGWWKSDGGTLENDRWIFTHLNAGVAFTNSSTNGGGDDYRPSAAPASDSKYLYFTETDGSVTKYDPSSGGSTVWKTKLSRIRVLGWGSSNASPFTPNLIEYSGSNGESLAVVISCSMPAEVYILDAETGDIMRTLHLSERPDSALQGSGVVYNGMLYVGVTFVFSTLSDSTSEEGFWTALKSKFPNTYLKKGEFLAINLLDCIASGSKCGPVWTFPPKPHSKSTGLYLAPGAPPAMDVKTSSLYLVTSSPRYPTQNEDGSWLDSILVLDSKTGNLKASRKFTDLEAWEEIVATRPLSLTDSDVPPPKGYSSGFGSGGSLKELKFCDCPAGFEAELTSSRSLAPDGSADTRVVGLCKPRGNTRPVWKRAICHQSDNSWKQTVLYIVDKGGWARCLNSTDLSPIWTNRYETVGSLFVSTGSPALDNRRCYSSFSNLLELTTLNNHTTVPTLVSPCGGWIAYDLLTGEILWNKRDPSCDGYGGPELGSWSVGPPTTTPGGILVASRIFPVVSSEDDLIGNSLVLIKGPPITNSSSVSYRKYVLALKPEEFDANSTVVYLLDPQTGEILRNQAIRYPPLGGFSLDDKCAWLSTGRSKVSFGSCGGNVCTVSQMSSVGEAEKEPPGEILGWCATG